MNCGASENPFRVTRLHGLPYQLCGETWDEVIERCHAMEFRGAVIGPHGSGKTTFLTELAFRLRQAGHSILIVDRYDSLSPLQRLWLRRRQKRLIVASHGPCALPTLHVCKAQADMLVWAVASLSGHEMDHETACALLEKHHDNMRDALRDLYDRVSSGTGMLMEVERPPLSRTVNLTEYDACRFR